MTCNISELIAPVYYDMHRDIKNQGHTFYNLPGGRGSAKSSFVSLEIVLGIMRDASGMSSAIVFRLVGADLRESVYNQVQWAIDTLGVSHLWKSKISPMRFEYVNGASIIFRGLDDPGKLKSIRPKQGIFRYVWFEEFSELPGENFQRNVLQSVVRGGDGFSVFRSFNPPISKNNWANRLIQAPEGRSMTLLTNYTQVPPEWLGEAFLIEAERLKELNPKAYQNEYMGEATGSGGEVFNSLEIRPITDQEVQEMEYTYRGLDFGFGGDPTCYLVVGYDRSREKIYLLDEIYKRHMSNSDIAEAIRSKGYNEFDRPSIFADCAEPKSIADLQGMGLKCFSCRKFPGCVKYRIKWLQKRTIVIDPQRTPNAYRELISYEYVTTKDGEFLTDLPDKDNHSIDALAYSLDRIIYSRKNTA